MSKILVVENDLAWVQDFKELLHSVFDEASQLKIINLAEEARREMDNQEFFDDLSLALVDLELAAGTGNTPGDYLGRDVILPKIRTQACWVPVILVSRYISGDPTILAELTPYDFDAVVPKEFFTAQKTNRLQWEQLRLKAALKRVSALTGRNSHELAELLEKEMRLEYGAGVRNQVEHYGKRKVEELLRLLDLGPSRIVLDEIVQGYSGLTVVKATCDKGNDSTTWLLKFGTNIGKLDRELQAHRRMFEEGFTRRLSVPVFWWRPVVWDSVGVIAYEFEEGSDTLFNLARNSAINVELGKIPPALQELYKGATVGTIIPRTCLQRLVGRLTQERGTWGSLVSALLEDQRNERLDRSVRVLVGREHGDLHARNILVGKQGPVLIDFAHFLGREQGGVPLLDLAKLTIDLSVWGTTDLAFADLLSGVALDSGVLKDIVGLYLVNREGKASEDERRLFGCAAACFLALYSVYEDGLRSPHRPLSATEDGDQSPRVPDVSEVWMFWPRK